MARSKSPVFDSEPKTPIPAIEIFQLLVVLDVARNVTLAPSLLAFPALADAPAAYDFIDRRPFRLLGLGGFFGFECFPAALAPGSPFLFSSFPCHNVTSFTLSSFEMPG